MGERDRGSHREKDKKKDMSGRKRDRKRETGMGDRTIE